jgi:hypothetical protein
MSLFKYLTSRTFFTQAFLAAAIVVGFTFLVIQFLDFRTNHGQEIKVPDLSKMKLEVAEEKLNELDLEVFLLDTVEFNADFPPFTILEQDPKAGSLVKDGRKVYVKLNAGEFTDITIPEFKDKTFRQISATIKSLTLKEYLTNDYQDIYSKYTGYLSNIKTINQKTIANIVKEFIGGNLFVKRNTLILLLINTDKNDNQYLG